MPTRIDSATDIAAKLIAFAVNKALHRDMTTEDIRGFYIEAVLKTVLN